MVTRTGRFRMDRAIRCYSRGIRMRRHIMTVTAVLAVAGLAAACSSSGDESAPATTSTSTSSSTTAASAPSTGAPAPVSSTPAPAPSASPSSTTTTTTPRPAQVENGTLRAKTCQDALPFMDQLRKADPAAPGKSAEDTIKNLPDTPEWPTLSPADRAAAIAGIRDAANGQCGVQ